jgi:hypothetical protein
MYQSYGINNHVTKLLKVHWHRWYVDIFHESPKWKVHGCQIEWSGWPRNVATTTYPSSWECLVQVPRHIPLMVLTNHIVCIQLWNKEVLQHIEVHVTRIGSLGGKRMVRKPAFCLQYRKHSPSDCLAHVRQLGVDSVIPRWLHYGDSPSQTSER